MQDLLREVIPYKTSKPTGARVRRLAEAMKARPGTTLTLALEEGLAVLEAKYFPPDPTGPAEPAPAGDA